MSLYTKYQTEESKEVEGVDIVLDYTEDGSPITFTLSRMGGANKDFEKALEAATKPYRRQKQLGLVIPPDEDAKIFSEVFASTVLRGWKNVQDENGNELPFSKDNAVKLFKDLPQVFSMLQSEAADIANFRKAALEKEAKN